MSKYTLEKQTLEEGVTCEECHLEESMGTRRCIGMQSHKRTNGEPWNTSEDITQQQEAHMRTYSREEIHVRKCQFFFANNVFIWRRLCNDSECE